ncbi:hypothetical protein C4577_00425 [Candidatus Parcubacteria bacterium]|nr:MAG: hypothetical protein C4577_00425 [Candidatus Parcubacteria bacterium]
MPRFYNFINFFQQKPQLFSSIFILLLIGLTYYKLFIFGKIPFPGDLLVESYFPWLDQYKIPVQNPLISDVFSQFFLWKYLAVDMIKSGNWPLWNPYSFSGTPFLATYHSATIYPLNILLLIPGYFGWGIFIFSQTFFAALNMFFLLSCWIKSNFAKFTGAFIFAFNGLMTTWLELGTAVAAISWLPLSIFAVEKYKTSLKFRYLLILLTSLTMTILAGNAQITTYAYIIVSIFAIIRLWDKKLLNYIKNTTSIAIIILLSITLCAPQLIPSLEILSKSIRSQDSYTQDNNFGLLPLREIFKLFIPDYYGNPVTRNYWGFLNYSETSSFLGTLTLPLLLFSLFYLKKNQISLFFLVVFLFSLYFSFQNSLSIWFYQLKIPLLTLSYASRLLFITGFSAAILAGLSLSQINSSSENLYRYLKLVLHSFAALLGIVIGTFLVKFVIFQIINDSPSEFYLNYYLNNKDFALVNFDVALRNTILPIAILGTSILVGNIINKISLPIVRKNTLSLFLVFILILSFLDFTRYFLKFNPFVSKKMIFPQTSTTQFLQSQSGVFRVGREHAEILPPNTWMHYKLQSFEGYDPIYINQYGKFMSFLNGGDIRENSSGRYAELSSKYSSAFLDAANVKYFVGILRDQEGKVPGDLINFKLKEAGYQTVFKDHSTVVLENTKALERAYFASDILIFPISETEKIYMNNLNLDPRKTIILEKDLNVKSVTGQGKVEIVNYTPNKVAIDTTTTQEEVLVLADQYEKGWTATIDGQITPISRANLIFRAIKIPPGTHRIVFSYQPASFRLGLQIASLTMFTVVIICLIFMKKKCF